MQQPSAKAPRSMNRLCTDRDRGSQAARHASWEPPLPTRQDETDPCIALKTPLKQCALLQKSPPTGRFPHIYILSPIPQPCQSQPCQQQPQAAECLNSSPAGANHSMTTSRASLRTNSCSPARIYAAPKLPSGGAAAMLPRFQAPRSARGPWSAGAPTTGWTGRRSMQSARAR